MSRELNQPIAILVDLGGPKIRLGEIPGESIFCRRDDEFFFVDGESTAPNELTATYEPLLDELSVGDIVMLADGTVSMQVEEVKPDRVRTSRRAARARSAAGRGSTCPT